MKYDVKFNFATAHRIELPFNCPHDVFCDENGHHIMWCIGHFFDRKVPVSVAALDWYRNLPISEDAKEIILHNIETDAPGRVLWAGLLKDLPKARIKTTRHEYLKSIQGMFN